MRAEPIEERHREGLREAAEREPQIHRFTNMYSLGFDRWFDLALETETEVPFVVHVDGRPVGSSRYPERRAVPQAGRDRLDVARARAVGDGREHRDEVPAARERVRVAGARCGSSSRRTPATCACAARCSGWARRFEGIFRKHMKLPDSIRDSAWYAIVDDDWPRVKAMLEAKIERHAHEVRGRRRAGARGAAPTTPSR